MFTVRALPDEEIEAFSCLTGNQQDNILGNSEVLSILAIYEIFLFSLHIRDKIDQASSTEYHDTDSDQW